MGKHEPGTPKYIANKIKAKGLQKLRWYCQMCQKQCRDENGFKCHMTSESHQRQLLLFADNQHRYLSEFSREFSSSFLLLLKHRFGTKRVLANRVYQEYITDRNHTHMNATQWVTLTGFVKWLGRHGKCVVDETEKGWFISYIDRDPETIQAQEEKAKKEKMDRDDKERMMQFIEKQIERGQALAKKEEKTVTDLIRKDDEKIKLDLSIPAFKKPEPLPLTAPVLTVRLNAPPKRDKREVKRKTALDEIIEDDEARKKRMKKRDFWLHEGIVVKVRTDSLGEKYQDKKGVIEKVIDKYVALVKMLDSAHKLKLDQEHLETVIPNLGRKVKILNGPYSGLIADLESINPDKFSATVKISSGPLNGRIVKDIPYEEISKLHVS